MKVLLKEDVEKLGYAGEVHKVAPGYGRNYLIPQGLAVLATPSVLKQAEVWRKRIEAQRAQMQAENEVLAARIKDLTLTFSARAGESGKLYGSVTMIQVTDRLNEMLGTDIDRRKIGDEPIRKLGAHKVPVRLSSELQPEVTVIVEPEGSVIPETAETEPEEEPEEVAEA